MHFLNRKNGRAALAAVAAGALAVTAACSGDGGGDDDATGEDGKIKLTVSVFGTFGYTEAGLEAAYEAENPNIDVVIEGDGVNFDQEFRPALETALETGSGAGDVVGIDEQGVTQLFSNSEHWYDLGGEYEGRAADYVDWKWELGKSEDGTLVGFGTDVGGMGMCYRTDLFAAAGLPTDREELAALWADWDGFKSVAQQFVDANTGAAFLDGPTQLQNMLLGQLAGQGDGEMYVDGDGNLTLDSPAAKQSIDTVLELQDMGAIGNFASWSDEWNAGMIEGGYAVMPCPGWMAGGVIQPTSGPDNAGKWDMAAAPGIAGNWGGSWLGVPAQSEHPEEAAALAAWLTAPEQQIKVFEAVGNFPSSPAAQADPRVADKTNEYFNNAPVGQIIGASVQNFPALNYSYYHPAVKGSIEGVLNGVADGTFKSEDAWSEIQTAAEEAMELASAGM
ncbi:extracellular solute-binding protein [Glycomyces luteolus]|uniref:Extracellular solute-binding protein n=1 Tax=Glycomyces luteolus TaxID=2670330 RepID=A0A9X3SSU2_9ACTN|nr:extracellular solute-binding protein [Glycomyces luteolus]MDA1362936.1 extracellular solute-binding protein [Glycomyces luteolus]